MRIVQRNFGDRLTERILSQRSQVIVGLDPRVDRLPEELRPATPSVKGTAHAVMAFNRAVVDAVADLVVGVKVQVAFYEQLGCAGMNAYASTIRYAREKGMIVIGDAKRNDIASTAAAYAAAHLGTPDGADEVDDFLVDAVTVNPYLGSDGVRPFVEAAAANGRGLFVLVKTSNPSSCEVQDLDCDGATVYERVAELVAEWGSEHRGHSGYSLVGAVCGATFPEELGRLRELMPCAPLLVPGFGAQGADVDDIIGAFDTEGLGAVVNASRGVIYAWERPPYAEEYGPQRWREAVWAAAADMRERIWRATRPDDAV